MLIVANGRMDVNVFHIRVMLLNGSSSFALQKQMPDIPAVFPLNENAVKRSRITAL